MAVRNATALKTEPRPWYRVVAQADPSVAEMLIFDEIGGSFWTDGVTAKEFVDALAALPEAVKTILVRVNSPGGSVFDAVAIANALRAQSNEKGRTIVMSIEGLAASAATIVTCAGDSIRVADNALMMIHNPIGLVIGEAADMIKAADMLGQIRGSIIATYRWVSAMTPEDLSAMMDAETWMDAEEAVANGFATEIVSGLKVAALFEPDGLAGLSVPEKYRERVAAFARTELSPNPQPATKIPADPRAVIAACKTAGCLDLADDLLGLPMEDVTTRLATAKAERERETARATEITALCTTNRLPELAAGYIAAKTPVAIVKAQLVIATAKIDGAARTDPALLPDAGVKPKPKIDGLAIYDRMNTPAKKGA